MKPEEKKLLIQRRSDWFHSIDVGDGIVTPGVVSPEYEQQLLRAMRIPDRLDGLRVLDIGTYDGFFAFECERRGAAEVVAIDVNPIDGRCFKLARDLLGSKVKYYHMSVYEMDEGVLGAKFDLVLFPGVFYHLRHILMSFDNIWKILKPQGTVLVETHVSDNHFVLADGKVTTLKDIDPRLLDVPLFRFYRKNELNAADWSNWFGGNVAAVLDVMGSAGFVAEHLGSWQSRAAFRGVKNPATPREWELGSYEGTSFRYGPDGGWTAVWHHPNLARGEPGGFVDAPAPNATICGAVLMRGWAAHQSGIRSVCVCVDGEQVSRTEDVNISRPDVAAVLPTIPGSDRSGWEVRLDASRLSPGQHILVVQATSKTGVSCNLGSVNVTVTK